MWRSAPSAHAKSPPNSEKNGFEPGFEPISPPPHNVHRNGFGTLGPSKHLFFSKAPLRGALQYPRWACVYGCIRLYTAVCGTGGACETEVDVYLYRVCMIHCISKICIALQPLAIQPLGRYSPPVHVYNAVSDRTCTCWPCNDRTHTRWQRSDRTVSYASTTQHCYFLFQVSRCASAVPSPSIILSYIL